MTEEGVQFDNRIRKGGDGGRWVRSRVAGLGWQVARGLVRIRGTSYFRVKRSKTVMTGSALCWVSKKPRIAKSPVTTGSHQNTPLPRLFGVSITMRFSSSR